MSRSDFESLTRREKAFIMKAYENKLVSDTQNINNAVANAIANVHRKKGKPWKHLWKKKPKRSETDDLKNEARKAQAEVNKSWVEKVYKANRK